MSTAIPVIPAPTTLVPPIPKPSWSEYVKHRKHGSGPREAAGHVGYYGNLQHQVRRSRRAASVAGHRRIIKKFFRNAEEGLTSDVVREQMRAEDAENFQRLTTLSPAELQHREAQIDKFIAEEREIMYTDLVASALPTFENEWEKLLEAGKNTVAAYKADGFRRLPPEKNELSRELGRWLQKLRAQYNTTPRRTLYTAHQDIDLAKYAEKTIESIQRRAGKPIHDITPQHFARLLASPDLEAVNFDDLRRAFTNDLEYEKFINDLTLEVPGIDLSTDIKLRDALVQHANNPTIRSFLEANLPNEILFPIIDAAGVKADVQNWSFLEKDKFKTKLIEILKHLKKIKPDETPSDEQLKDLLIAHIADTDGAVSVEQAFWELLDDTEKTNFEQFPDQRDEILKNSGISELIDGIRKLNNLCAAHPFYAKNAFLITAAPDRLSSPTTPGSDPAVERYWVAKNTLAGARAPHVTEFNGAITETENAIRANGNLQVDVHSNKVLGAFGDSLVEVYKIFRDSAMARAEADRNALADLFVKTLAGGQDLPQAIETKQKALERMIIAIAETTKNEHPQLNKALEKVDSLSDTEKKALADLLGVDKSQITSKTLLSYFAKQYAARPDLAMQVIDKLELSFNGTADEMRHILDRANYLSAENRTNFRNQLTILHHLGTIADKPEDKTATEAYKKTDKQCDDYAQERIKSRQTFLFAMHSRYAGLLREAEDERERLLQERYNILSPDGRYARDIETRKKKLTETESKEYSDLSPADKQARLDRIEARLKANAGYTETLVSGKMQLELANNTYRHTGQILPPLTTVEPNFFGRLVNLFGNNFQTYGFRSEHLPGGVKAITGHTEINEDGLVLIKGRYLLENGASFTQLVNVAFTGVYYTEAERAEMAKKRLKVLLGNGGQGLHVGFDGLYLPSDLNSLAGYLHYAYSSHYADFKLPAGLREFSLLMDFIGFMLGGIVLGGIPFYMAYANYKESALHEMWATYNYSPKEYASRVVIPFHARMAWADRKLTELFPFIKYDTAQENEFKSSIPQAALKEWNTMIGLYNDKFDAFLNTLIEAHLKAHSGMKKAEIPAEDMNRMKLEACKEFDIPVDEQNLKLIEKRAQEAQQNPDTTASTENVVVTAKPS